jgi:hypothetical protein
MGKRYTGPLPGIGLNDKLAAWLQQLAADHDGDALFVAKTVGSMMIEQGPGTWFRLSAICALAEQPSAIVEGILHRLRRRGRLHFERRDEQYDGVAPEYRFTIPTEMPERLERDRVWRKWR